MQKLPLTATIHEAKKELREHWLEGASCPVCNQYVKLYHRKITSSMAYGLILVYRYFRIHPEAEFVHVSDYLNTLEIDGAIRNTGDITKLRYWGLIDSDKTVREDGSKRSGFWTITEKGKQFVRGEITVPSHVKIFNNKYFGFTGEHITIREALQNKFNYDELMNQ